MLLDPGGEFFARGGKFQGVDFGARDAAGGLAALASVHARRRESQWREQRVEALHAAPADQGERAFKAHRQFAEHGFEGFGNLDGAGGLGDLKQGAIDIEKQRQIHVGNDWNGHHAAKYSCGDSRQGTRKRRRKSAIFLSEEFCSGFFCALCPLGISGRFPSDFLGASLRSRPLRSLPEIYFPQLQT